MDVECSSYIRKKQKDTEEINCNWTDAQHEHTRVGLQAVVRKLLASADGQRKIRTCLITCEPVKVNYFYLV